MITEDQLTRLQQLIVQRKKVKEELNRLDVAIERILGFDTSGLYKRNGLTREERVALMLSSPPSGKRTRK